MINSFKDELICSRKHDGTISIVYGCDVVKVKDRYRYFRDILSTIGIKKERITNIWRYEIKDVFLKRYESVSVKETLTNLMEEPTHGILVLVNEDKE